MRARGTFAVGGIVHPHCALVVAKWHHDKIILLDMRAYRRATRRAFEFDGGGNLKTLPRFQMFHIRIFKEFLFQLFHIRVFKINVAPRKIQNNTLTLKANNMPRSDLR